MTLPPLPVRGGAYRWFYADAHAGEYTVVCIFMIGAVFSPRATVAAARGVSPQAHCAVNCAVYRGGRRVAWVFTEHAGARVDGDTLRIGRSTFAYAADGSVRVAITERTAPFGAPVRVDLTLVPEAPAAPAVLLQPGGAHEWHAVMPRARATIAVPTHGITADGVGYHDVNHGAHPLGAELPGWRWTRVHAASRTEIHYRLPAPAEDVVVRERGGDVRLERCALDAEPLRRSRWGLDVPERLALAECDPGPLRMLESSPFYARLEADGGGVHALGEVADFRRFARPWIRWMAHFRLRVERVA